MNIFSCCKKPQADPPTPTVFHINPLFTASAQKVTRVPSVLTGSNSFRITDAPSPRAVAVTAITSTPPLKPKSTTQLPSPPSSTSVLDADYSLEGRCSSVTLPSEGE